MYNTEHDFKRAIVAHLKKEQCDVYSIETGAVSIGVPDLYIQSVYFGDCWLELKNEKTQSLFQDGIKVSWRPGQQVWYHNYMRYHATQKLARYVVTAVALKNGVAFIRNAITYPNNYITLYSSNMVCFTKEEWKQVTLTILLSLMSTEDTHAEWLTVSSWMHDFVSLRPSDYNDVWQKVFNKYKQHSDAQIMKILGLQERLADCRPLRSSMIPLQLKYDVLQEVLIRGKRV